MKTSYLPWAIIGMTALVGCSSESATPNQYPAAGTGGIYAVGQGGSMVGPGTSGVLPAGGASVVGQTGTLVAGGATTIIGTSTSAVVGGATSVTTGTVTTVGGAGGVGGTTGTKTSTGGAGGTGGTKTTAGGTTGTGGTTSTGGSRTCATSVSMISDFEEGPGAPKVLAATGVNGAWEAFNNKADSTAGAVGTQTMAVEATGSTTACSLYALHTTGSGWGSATAGWVGVGLTNLAGTATAPTVFNATAKSYTGIRFKAKLGTGHAANAAVRFNVSTPETEGTGSGGKCTDVAATTTKAALPCYQHAGRFLQEEYALTTAWKTVSLCFDRDLYPLSLPSNLTNAQRDAIGANILKLQFQFNQGKNYNVSSYPSEGKYADIPNTAAFDFWLDDLEFTTEACATANFASTDSAAAAFPQNKAVGSCAIATNAAKYNTAITQAYARWKARFAPDGSKIVAPEQSGITTSEAMGYGMLIAAAMGDKTTFDKFWTYVKTQLTSANNTLMTWSSSAGANGGSATDGDLDIAYALLMANKQWPSGGYKTPSDTMAASILANDVLSGSNVLKGGNQWIDRFNPSYFAPSYMRKFTGFGSVITANYTLVTNNIAAATAGIPTDWADVSSGAPADKGSAQVFSDLTGIVYGYDAARVPWRIGLDVCGDGSANKAIVTSIINFFATTYDQGATIDLLKAGWTKSTGTPPTVARNMQGSFIGPMGIAGMAAGNAVLRDRSFRAILDILENGDFNHTYFPSTVGMLTLLTMSGNFPTP